MKKIFLFIAVMLGTTLSSAFSESIPNWDNTNSENILYRSLPDSLYPILKNKPIIFYSYGHYGYSWSLIALIDSTYRAFSGRVGYLGDRHLNEATEANQFDTAQLFSQNSALLSWGFDTIPTEIIYMEKVNVKPYISFYIDFFVTDSVGKNVFSSDDAMVYSGSDSVNFNNKFHKLCLIMRWISDAGIRQFIPDSAIYSSRSK